MTNVPTATDGQVFDEYLDDIKLERLLPLLENINRNCNSISLILDQFRGVPCLVTAEFSHTVIPPEERSTDPIERLKQIARNQTFKRLIIEPDLQDL
jgi:hypothetical protein